eukprot:CAMPEP_0194688306 /NCGR_PEP_ID=MMETSP0295-20121207/16840_1 /TAXON_ID=39354 /ORGANISM="Heterosigma akashiwo, Strain CCMP2393" /LENGTH=175 /DNA_ID=CAMNT_0039576937 /DNA_START=35 /DNA_END=558 /DNA_ORIENTATION=-
MAPTAVLMAWYYRLRWLGSKLKDSTWFKPNFLAAPSLRMGYMKPLVLISGLLALNSVGALSIKSILGKESLTDLIIPQDWSDAFKTVADILDALKDAIDDEQEQKFPLALNLSLLHIYHRHLQDRYSRALIVTKDAKTPEQELEFATNALRYMHFSSAAYGALMGTLIGVMEGPG